MREAELRDESFRISQELNAYCEKKGVPTTQFAVAWCMANPILTSVILGPRTMEQFDDNFGALNVTITPEDEAFIDTLIPPGEHSGKGFQDIGPNPRHAGQAERDPGGTESRRQAKRDCAAIRRDASYNQESG